VRVRRQEARRRFIADAREGLYEIIETEAIDDAVAEIASEAIADQFRIRSLENLVVRKRRAAVDRVLERRRQAQAWMDIEQRVRELDSRDPVQISPSPTKKKRSIEEVIVNKNRKSITKLRRIESTTDPVSTYEVESLRAMMASAAQLLG
jgi:hypothetical protein